MHVPITALFAAINAVFNIGLAMNVTRLRGVSKIFLGTGTDEQLLTAARRHGNNAEYVPLALVLMLLCEAAGANAIAMWTIGGLLTVGRITHAIGVGNVPAPTRALGALLTWFAILGAGVYAAVLAW